MTKSFSRSLRPRLRCPCRPAGFLAEDGRRSPPSRPPGGVVFVLRTQGSTDGAQAASRRGHRRQPGSPAGRRAQGWAGLDAAECVLAERSSGATCSRLGGRVSGGSRGLRRAAILWLGVRFICCQRAPCPGLLLGRGKTGITSPARQTSSAFLPAGLFSRTSTFSPPCEADFSRLRRGRSRSTSRRRAAYFEWLRGRAPILSANRSPHPRG